MISKKVENLCKSLRKTMRISRVKNVYKNRNILFNCVKQAFSTNFSNTSHNLFHIFLFPILINLFHISTSPITITTTYFNNKERI